MTSVISQLMEHYLRRTRELADLELVITYADGSTDTCTITENDEVTWTDYQQPKTLDRNIAIMLQVKDLKASLLALGAKTISLGPPSPNQ